MKKFYFVILIICLLIPLQSFTLAPPKGKALIYIIRDSWFGRPFKYFTTCDGKNVGYTYGGTYIYTFVSPGSHLLVTKSDITTKLTITVKAGGIYYLHTVAYPVAWKGGCHLKVLSASEGEEKLAKCKLSSGNGK